VVSIAVHTSHSKKLFQPQYDLKREILRAKISEKQRAANCCRSNYQQSDILGAYGQEEHCAIYTPLRILLSPLKDSPRRIEF